MKKMLRLTALLIVVRIHAGVAAEPSVEVILSLEQRFNSGLMEKDEARFGQLLADNLVHIGFEGQIAGKTEYMAFFKTGNWRYVKYEPSNVAVKRLGDMAVVTGRVDRIIKINDKETAGAFAFTHVWSLSGNDWQLTSSQVTALPSAPAAKP